MALPWTAVFGGSSEPLSPGHSPGATSYEPRLGFPQQEFPQFCWRDRPYAGTIPHRLMINHFTLWNAANGQTAQPDYADLFGGL